MTSQRYIQQYYEDQYWKERRRGSLGRVRSNLRGMDVQSGMCIIDVGCGLGEAGLYLAAQGAQPVGIERKLVLLGYSLLPLRYTYQLVFVCQV